MQAGMSTTKRFLAPSSDDDVMELSLWPRGAPTIFSWGWGNDTKAIKDEMAETVLFVVTAISWAISCCWRNDTNLHIFRGLVRTALQRAHAWEGRAALVWPIYYVGQTMSWRTWVRTLVYSCNSFWDYCSLTVPLSDSHLLQGKPSQTERQCLVSPALPVRPPYASMDAHNALTPSCVNGTKVIKLSPIQKCVLKIMDSIWDIVFQLINKNIPWGEEEVSPCLTLCLGNTTCASNLGCEGMSWLRGPGWFSPRGQWCKQNPRLHLST